MSASSDPPLRRDDAIAWSGEWRGALQSLAAMLPFVLSYGFIAFGVLGPAAAQIGLGASLSSVVLGGWLYVALGRARLPAASPSASSCLILGAAVAQWAHDPALQPAAGGTAALLALAALTVSAAGVLQVLIGMSRAGSLARFVPQPVLAGFMNGIAVLIVVSQLPAVLGVPAERLWRDGWAALHDWQAAAVSAAAGTALLVLLISRVRPRAPAALLALVLAGVGVVALEALLGAAGRLIEPVGPLAAALPTPDTLYPLLGDGGMSLLERHGPHVLTTALLLALIGALESVLNLAAVDHQVGARADPNRELLALGATNLALGMVGGLPVVYLRLRAQAAYGGGGRSWRSIALGGLLIAVVFSLALPLVALCPRAVVAGIVVMLAWTLVDRWTLGLLRASGVGGDDGRDPARAANIAVIASVCVVTVLWGFVAGVALGVLLSLLIFIRALNRSLVRQRYRASEIPSRRLYAAAQEAALRPARAGIEVIELEGALFFGNVERLLAEVDADRAPVRRRAMVLDLRRVSTIDASGAVALARLRESLATRDTPLLLAGVTIEGRHGRALQAHGVLPGDPAQLAGWHLHPDADHATEAAEREALARAGLPLGSAEVPLERCSLFDGMPEAAARALAERFSARSLAAGERLFAQGEPGDALYVLSAGSISVVDPVRRQRFVSFSPGMCFGETAVLDGGGRTADAVADEPSTVHALTVAALETLQRDAPASAAQVYRNLARHLSERLRDAAAAWRRAAG